MKITSIRHDKDTGREMMTIYDADVLLDVRIGRMGKELFFGTEMGHRVVVQDIQNFQKSLIGAALTHGPVEIVDIGHQHFMLLVDERNARA